MDQQATYFTKGKGKIKADNPPLDPITLLQFVTFLEREAIYKRRKSISPEQLDVLGIIVRHFVSDGLGSTCYYVSQRLNALSKGECRNVQYKLQRLMLGEYIEVCNMVGNANVYVPTRKALEELSELCK